MTVLPPLPALLIELLQECLSGQSDIPGSTPSGQPDQSTPLPGQARRRQVFSDLVNQLVDQDKKDATASANAPALPIPFPVMDQPPKQIPILVIPVGIGAAQIPEPAAEAAASEAAQPAGSDARDTSIVEKPKLPANPTAEPGIFELGIPADPELSISAPKQPDQGTVKPVPKNEPENGIETEPPVLSDPIASSAEVRRVSSESTAGSRAVRPKVSPESVPVVHLPTPGLEHTAPQRKLRDLFTEFSAPESSDATDTPAPAASAEIPKSAAQSDSGEAVPLPRSPLAFAARLVPGTLPGAAARGDDTGAPAPEFRAGQAASDPAPKTAERPEHPETMPVARVASPSRWHEQTEMAAGSDGEPITARTVPGGPAPPFRPDFESPAPEGKPSHQPPDAQSARANSVPEGAIPVSPARDIHLHVEQGGQRVDVRLIERGGEIRVAVRTPDAGLAGTLRGDLPALSSRLEQTGFRAQTWHPAAAPASWSRTAEGGPAQNSQNGGNPLRQGGQQQQQQAPPRRSKPAAEESAANSPQGKEFAWFVSQLP
ncbi:MAG: hypothetical protein C5B51_22950 [Terriglobia bacterium]|nr:MAG: hypothetical protein C5B51_22950 [Terriglobia bacterium]